MSPKTLSVATLGLLSAVLAGLIMLAGCGGGSSSSTTPTGSPAVTLSTSSLTFSSGVGVASAPQSVTVTDSGTATLTFSGITVSSGFTQTNTCGTSIGEGGACTISVTFTPSTTGTVTGSLTITDNASGSPQAVTLSGTGTSVSLSTNTLTFSGVAVGSTSAAQSVTLDNAGTTALAVSSTTISGDFSISNNTCGSSVAVGGSCTISVTFTPQGSGPWTGTLTIVDGAGTQTVALTGTNTVANTAQVTVSFGPNGNTENPETNYYNGIYTTVTVCEPGTTTCQTIPNVLVDTGSVGLRVLSNQLGSVTLPQVTDPSTGNPIYECVEYGDLSYTWGPIQMATVQVGGETASQIPAASGGTATSGIPIQVISAGVTPPSEVGLWGTDEGYDNPCLVSPTGAFPSGGLNDDSVANLGSNGILGIGNYQQDCGADCTSTANTSGQYLIWDASSSNYYIQAVSLLDQAWNPVSAFSSTDTNGVVLQLPSIPATGQATATGTLTFGIGTETNNAIPNTATIYELDDYGNFASATFNGVGPITSTNSGGSFIDSGSNALFVSDETTLGTTDCLVSGTDIGFYCPSSPLNLSLGLTGSNGTSTTVTLNIENALNLFSANTSFAAFNDLGGPSCIPTTDSPCSLATDYFDLGLPFFFGQTIFVGIAGTSTTYPNGYWAF